MGREYYLVLRFIVSIRTYRVIGRDYTKLVEENGFKVGQSLDLWLFRVQRSTSDVIGELQIALVIVDDEEANGRLQVDGA
ncbi:hypothetical protein Cni_G14115 [Canna indica]|uniref:Uncharacterized protein n=1 Tax=Canna indica TaxID=4628 RepID=A0AAQ3KFR0_9LILI|nr:hypothetical protein Cni_G14115 [Canna indica]